MERLFEILFKVRPVLFREGEVVLGGSTPATGLLVVLALLGVTATLTYGMARGRSTRRDRWILGSLRVVTLGILLVCLLRPTLVLSSTVPQRNFVGILVDDSRSMQLPGADGSPRSAVTGEVVGSDSELIERLSERFALRFFSFSDATRRVQGAEALDFDGTRTDLASALDRAREELSSVPLSGMVVLTDGADNGGRALAEALVPLQAASVPVFPVALGDEVLSPDLQVAPVELPRTVLKGSAVVVDVRIDHRGMRDRTVSLLVEDGERLVAEEAVELRGDDEPATVRVRFSLDEAGHRRLRFRVPAEDDEVVVRNNARELSVEVRERREKILYFEGEPRYEVKFMRRAVSDDENLQLVVLQRSADNKFLRLDVDDADELVDGFPSTREELFAYRAVVLGSVEASFFTPDQLRMLEEFAAQRGGGLLALGGRSALAEGGYQGTAVGAALPIVLEAPAGDPQASFVQVKVAPTLAGRSHPAAQLRRETETPDEVWEMLPSLSTLNRVTRVKPGATALLSGTTDDGEERVVLAYQRYGRGKTLALPVQDSWLWQMHADVPLDDPSHEVLWQQLLRWLVEGVPDRVEARLERESVEPGESVTLRTTVLDSTYLEVNDASVVATLTGPGGAGETRVLEWTVDEDGVYATTLTPDRAGDWMIDVSAGRGGGTLGEASLQLRVGPSDAEFFDAGRRTALLERLAEETGGRFHTPATVGDLPEDLQYTGAGVTLTEERDLWDMPVLFLALVVLVATEWGYRRRRGLA